MDRRYSQTGKLEIVLERDGNRYSLVSVEGNKVPEHKNTMSDVQAFNYEFDAAGEDLFWDESDQPTSPFVRILGVMWWERINSIDYGTDYDSGFDIELQESE